MPGERWLEAFREAPEVFDAFSRAEDPEGRITAALLRHLRPAGRTVLEVGCGTGRIARSVAREAALYVAVEPALPMLRLARTDPPPGMHLLSARGEALPLRDASVDAVLAGWVFAFLPPPVRERALAEAERVLKCPSVPGGGVWLIENHWESEFQELRGRRPGRETSEVAPLLAAGFKIVETVETEVRFASEDDCLRVLGYLCGDAAAARLRERPVARLAHRVLLLHRQRDC